MIKVGDNVVLNSGGPVMAVVKIDPNGNLECTWHTPAGLLQEHEFAPVCVQKVGITEAG